MKGKSIYFLYIFLSIFLGLIFLINLGGSNSWAFPLNVYECFPSRNESDPNASTDVSSLETIRIVFTHEMDLTATEAAFHFYREDDGIDLVGGDFSLDGNELTFTPPPPLQEGIVYVVRIDSTAKSADEPSEYLFADWIMKIVINRTVGYSQTYDTEDGLPANSISSMALDGLNRLWVGTRSESQGASICYFNGDIWTEDTPPVDPFHIDDIPCMVVDNEGILWAGLNIEYPQDDPNTPILAKLEDNNWHIISSKDLDNILPGFINGMAVDSENNIWMITDTTGLLRYNYIAEEVIRYPAPEGRPPKNYMKSLMIDNDDNVWIGTDICGIWKVDAQSHFWDEQYALLDDFPIGANINTMGADPSGNVWVGTDNGLLKLDLSGPDPNWTEYTTATVDGLPGDIINVLGVDPSNDLVWVGTSGGLGEFNINTEKGTAYIEELKSDISDKAINALDVNSRGEVWFGTDDGLQMLDEISPYITNKDCSGTELVFYVNDDGMGVDPNSIEVQVDGEDVTGVVNKTKESNNSYKITYNNAFPENVEIEVTVTAEDLIGNQLIDYQFQITHQESPYITNETCSMSELIFYIIDNGLVVDPNSIEVQVDGEDVTEYIQIIEGANNSYQVTCSPENFFLEGKAITVIVNVEDLNGNPLLDHEEFQITPQEPGTEPSAEPPIDLSGSGCFIDTLQNRTKVWF